MAHADDFLTRIYPELQRKAKSRFRNRQSLVVETSSCGWEIYSRTTSDVTPGYVAFYGIKTVTSRRRQDP